VPILPAIGQGASRWRSPQYPTLFGTRGPASCTPPQDSQCQSTTPSGTLEPSSNAMHTAFLMLLLAWAALTWLWWRAAGAPGGGCAPAAGGRWPGARRGPASPRPPAPPPAPGTAPPCQKQPHPQQQWQPAPQQGGERVRDTRERPCIQHLSYKRSRHQSQPPRHAADPQTLEKQAKNSRASLLRLPTLLTSRQLAPGSSPGSPSTEGSLSPACTWAWARAAPMAHTASAQRRGRSCTAESRLDLRHDQGQGREQAPAQEKRLSG
jgi:hypothetical protein